MKKLLERWKQEWWIKHASELAKKYEANRIELEAQFKQEIADIQRKWEMKRELLSIETAQKELEHSIAMRKLKEEQEVEKSSLMNTLKNELALLKSNESELTSTRHRVIAEKDRLLEKMIDLRTAWEEKRELIEGNIVEEEKYLADKRAIYKSQNDELGLLIEEVSTRKLALSTELFEMNATWKAKRDSLKEKISTEEAALNAHQEELNFLRGRINTKQADLNKLNAELNLQIKTLEAKTSPNTVWATAFSDGATKTWDFLIPVMTQNMEKMLKKVREDSTMEAINRLRKDNHVKN